MTMVVSTSNKQLPVYKRSAKDVSKKRRRRNFSLYTAYWTNTSLKQKAAFCALVIFSVWYLIRSVKRMYRKFQGEQLPPPQRLDFLIAGFPKSGTTTLLATLKNHPQIAMDSTEYCQIARPIQQDDMNLKRLNRYLYALKNDVVKERAMSKLGQAKDANQQSATLLPDNLLSGIKCPDAVKNFKAIHRLSQHSPDCKFIVGVRHPILFLQSFYNYRVNDAHVQNRPDIPSLFEIWDKQLNWRDVSPDAPRFEMFLSQFGKTELSLDQMQSWFVDRPMLAVKPNRFKIFLYSLEQVEDPSQNAIFRRDLQNFLGLSEEVQPFGHENKLLSISKEFKETIDICSPHFATLRREMLHHAETTVAYMHQFLESSDVLVSNRPLLLQHINSWTRDPCDDATVVRT